MPKPFSTTTNKTEQLISQTMRDLEAARESGNAILADLLQASLNDLLDHYPHTAQV